MDCHALSSIDALLDEALHDVVASPPDLRAAAQARRRRIVGTSLMATAGTGIAALELSVGWVGPVGALLVCVAAIALLVAGAWLIARAGKDELRRFTDNQSDAECGALGKALSVMTPAIARRRRHFGISMLVLACFCLFSARLPSERAFFPLMWAGISVLLIGVGAWQIERAAKEREQAEAMRDAALNRKAAQAKAHVRRVQ